MPKGECRIPIDQVEVSWLFCLATEGTSGLNTCMPICLVGFLSLLTTFRSSENGKTQCAQLGGDNNWTKERTHMDSDLQE